MTHPRDGKRFVLVALVGALAAAAAQDGSMQVNVFHPLECVLGETITVNVYLYNRSEAEQTYKGEIADDQGKLVLSGDWALTLEETREGQIVSSKPMRPKQKAESRPQRLAPRDSKDWKWKVAVADLADHPGIFRFRISHGQASAVGRFFRIVRQRGAPKWIALTYRPDKPRYFIGEPITVHFALRSNGKDEFHFEEGGDYRGANRHLRWCFTATTAQGQKAVDPRPDQSCFGGMGQSDPHVKPGEAYEKALPLLAYLVFPAPGRYRVECHQAMGFGEPVKALDPRGHWGGYVRGGSFEVELRVPTAAEAAERVRAVLGMTEEYKRRAGLATLRHQSYLEPLARALAKDADPKRAAALVYGMAGIVTPETTRRLLALAGDERSTVRVAALRQLLWRLPDPKAKGKPPKETPPRYYVPYPSPTLRLAELRATWDDGLRPTLRSALEKGLRSADLDEVETCAVGLSTLAATDAVELLAGAADRVAPTVPVAAAHVRCVNQIAHAAWLLADLGAKPCRVDATSSPGRLAVWANMVRTHPEHRVDDWQELLLHMMRLDCSVTRMAAIRWLPRDFARRDEIPWKELLLDSNRQVWWYAIQVARKAFPPGLKALAQQVHDQTVDRSKRGDLARLIQEIDARAKRKPD